MEQAVKVQEMNVEEIGAVAGGGASAWLPQYYIGGIISRSGCPTCSRVALLPGEFVVDPVAFG